MIETGIYLSESEKETIIRAYEDSVSYAKEFEDEEELQLINSESFTEAIALLKEKNIISLNLILNNMFAREEISITEEMFDELIKGMDSESKEFYKKFLSENGQKMSIGRIRTLFLGSDSIKSLQVPLTPEVSRNYKKVIELFTKIKFKDSQEEVLERLEEGIIKYEDIEKLVKILKKVDTGKNIDVIKLFENGRIDLSNIRRNTLERSRARVY